MPGWGGGGEKGCDSDKVDAGRAPGGEPASDGIRHGVLVQKGLMVRRRRGVRRTG